MRKVAKVKRIVLIGGYGHTDIGDESQLTTSLLNLRKYVPNAQFLALSDNPENTREYHKIKSNFSIKKYLTAKPLLFNKPYLKLFIFVRGLILLFNARRLRKNKKPVFLSIGAKRFLENLKRADILFNVGGGNINSKFRWGGLFPKCFMYLICRTLGKPIVLSGQSIGPFYSWLDKFLARFALNRVNIITLRERRSLTALQKLGVTKPIIKVTADDATLLPPISPNKVKEVLLKEGIVEQHPLIGMNMIQRGLLIKIGVSKVRIKRAQELLAKAADFLISKYNATIVFIPMQYKAGSDDRIAASEVLKLIKHKEKVHILKGEYDDKTLKGLIGKMDFAIGLRYHFLVFAVNSQVPSIGIYLDDYYKIKVRGILELVGQGMYACDIEKTSFQDITNLIEKIMSNKEVIRRELKTRTKHLEKLSLFSIKCAVKLLSINPINSIRFIDDSLNANGP